MENIQVNKVELVGKSIVLSYKLALFVSLIGLAWSCVSAYVFGNIPLIFLAFLLFPVMNFVSLRKIKKEMPELAGTFNNTGKFIFSAIVLTVLSVIIAYASLKLNRVLIGYYAIFLLIFAFSFYWGMTKMKNWNKNIEKKLIDERMNEINKKSLMGGLYTFFILCILLYTVYTYLVPSLVPSAMLAVAVPLKLTLAFYFVNIMWVVVAVRSLVFMHYYLKDQDESVQFSPVLKGTLASLLVILTAMSMSFPLISSKSENAPIKMESTIIAKGFFNGYPVKIPLPASSSKAPMVSTYLVVNLDKGLCRVKITAPNGKVLSSSSGNHIYLDQLVPAGSVYILDAGQNSGQYSLEVRL